MSVKTLAAVADLSDVPATCKLLLYGLAIITDEHGQCWPTYARMKQLTGLSERGIRGTLTDLEKRGLLMRSAPNKITLAVS